MPLHLLLAGKLGCHSAQSARVLSNHAGLISLSCLDSLLHTTSHTRLRDKPAHGVWRSKLTLKYDCDSCKAAVAHGSGGSLVISLGFATAQFCVVQWILKRAVGWQQIPFWDTEGWDPLLSSDCARNALAYSLQWLLLELQKLDAPSLSIRIQGECPCVSSLACTAFSCHNREAACMDADLQDPLLLTPLFCQLLSGQCVSLTADLHKPLRQLSNISMLTQLTSLTLDSDVESNQCLPQGLTALSTLRQITLTHILAPAFLSAFPYLVDVHFSPSTDEAARVDLHSNDASASHRHTRF